jgi:hypothetical protein
LGGPYEVEEWYEEAADSEQFRYWQAFHRIQPWGPWRDNLHAGIIAQAIYATSPNGPIDINATKFILDTSDKSADQSAPNEESLRAAGMAMGLKFIEAPACPPSPA